MSGECRDGPAVTTGTGEPTTAPAETLTRRGAKDGRLNTAQHVGDALAEVVREGLLLEGRQAVADHMPHPGQLPELAAHGGGGACRTKGGQEPGSGRAAPPAPRQARPVVRRPPHPPGCHKERATEPHSRTRVTSPSTAAGSTGLLPPLPVEPEADLGDWEATSGTYHFPAVSGEGAGALVLEKSAAAARLWVGGAWASGRGLTGDPGWAGPWAYPLELSTFRGAAGSGRAPRGTKR